MDIKTEGKKYKLNFDFKIPKDLHTNFQGIFSYIKKKYQIKFSRKSHIDSILKKCKGKFYKVVHQIMNISLNTTVKRLPQKFITNITIKYNQRFLSKNIIELYQEFNLLPEKKILEEKGLIKPDKIEVFHTFCSYSISELYEIYTQSQRFLKEINIVKHNDGRRNGILYEFVAQNFCAYYENNKPHSLKEKNNNENDKNNPEFNK